MAIPFPRVAPRLVLSLLLSGPAAGAFADDTIQWRTDYQAARREAQEKGVPLLVEVASPNCVHCRRQDATTFQDPTVVGLLNGQFVAVRVDGTKDTAFVQALKVQMFPTTVLAGPDGKILAFLSGYVAADQLRDHARRAVLTVTTPDWVARDLEEANKAIARSDYVRAVTLLKGVAQDAAESPAKAKAEQVLAEVEKTAADRVARANRLATQGEETAAAAGYAAVAREFAGTEAAADATAKLTGSARGPGLERTRSARARDLLAAARDAFKGDRFADCLDGCDQLAAQFADLPEARDAAALAGQVRADPDRLAAACEQQSERTAALYLSLADAWLKKGQQKEALACLEKATRLNPAGRSAELAQAKLTSIQKGGTPAVQAGFEKK